MPLIRLLRALSDGIVRIERILLMLLVFAVVSLVLLNVGFRLFEITLAWADELAVLAMAWSGFVGASLMLRARIDPAVRLLHEAVGPLGVRALRVSVSVLASVFGIILIWLNWIWFNPPGLIAAGFDISTFEATTFNFIYSGKTPVLVWPVFWFYLVMPWFALTLSVHALTNLAEDLGLIPQRNLARELDPSEDDVPLPETSR
ncbi:ABC transporte, permease protein, putative [Roseobacter sp. AzwK-3b]|uniref:TRAP transporter small permease n=1 Tax=Roseobacter sp. AzwK-3b TaxID=351016 RepID=UPI0001569474|nr:TRAP transporter small permease subunit [Roseobacter sp. AzwK-3b]EDM72344.1 ABC transporte, permease protein, putative [Roseobacter sp. AzwK-3b]